MALYGQPDVLSEDILAKLLQATGQQPQAAAPNAVPPMPPIAPPASMPPQSPLPIQPQPMGGPAGQVLGQQQPQQAGGNNKWMALAQALAPLAGSLIGGTRVGYGMLQGQQQAQEIQRKMEQDRLDRAQKQQQIDLQKEHYDYLKTQNQLSLEQKKEEEERLKRKNAYEQFSNLVGTSNEKWTPEMAKTRAQTILRVNKIDVSDDDPLVASMVYLAANKSPLAILVNPQDGTFNRAPDDPAVIKQAVESGWEYYGPSDLKLAEIRIRNLQQEKIARMQSDKEALSREQTQQFQFMLERMREEAAEKRMRSYEAAGEKRFDAAKTEAIAKTFDSNPITKNYVEVQQKYQSVKEIVNSGAGGPADMATIYEFMRALDPTSVVRETEYAAAAKSGNIFKGMLARFNGYFKAEGGILPEEVKQSFVKIMEIKLGVLSTQYLNLKSEMGKRINNATGRKDGESYLVDYESAFQTGKTEGIITTPDGKKWKQVGDKMVEVP